jgi:uncharacterized protein YdeI (YjbR/CyaY-like superfamily)
VKPRFFRSQSEFHQWLETHHAAETELWIGFYKKSSKMTGITYREALDESLCFGWIDGRIKSIDADRYMQRFTPRTASSHWSNVNVKRYAELKAAGMVRPTGEADHGRRTPERTGQAAYEQKPVELTPAQLRQLKANKRAWEFYSRQPPSYQRVTKFFVRSAKQETTRQRRLKLLIDCSAAGRRIPQYISPVGKK